MTTVERIVKGRELDHAGFFHRKVVNRVPNSVAYDELTLECNHIALIYPETATPETERCCECIRAWVKEAE